MKTSKRIFALGLLLSSLTFSPFTFAKAISCNLGAPPCELPGAGDYVFYTIKEAGNYVCELRATGNKPISAMLYATDGAKTPARALDATPTAPDAVNTLVELVGGAKDGHLNILQTTVPYTTGTILCVPSRLLNKPSN